MGVEVLGGGGGGGGSGGDCTQLLHILGSFCKGRCAKNRRNTKAQYMLSKTKL